MREKDLVKTYEDHCGLLHNIRNYEDIACKKTIRLERYSNPRPLLDRCRARALPTELSSQLGAGGV